MIFPKPYLPKCQAKWPLKWRQMFARFYWNPWWKAHHFFTTWVSVKGMFTFMDRLVWALYLKRDGKQYGLVEKAITWWFHFSSGKGLYA